MKTRLYKRIAMFLVLALTVPILCSMNVTVAKAAAPALTKTTLELIGIGEVYDLNVTNKVSKSTYAWSSSNKKVVTVNKNGVVTSVSAGTAKVSCKITYPTKKTTTLVCNVTVTVPATAVAISNASLTNGAHVLQLNESKDLDAVLTPSNSSDKVYWSIGNGDKGCIRIDDAAAGKITAIKTGKVILVATAAKSATASAAKTSFINDAVIIEVVGPVAEVKDVNITDSNIITATFASPIQENTVIGTGGSLSGNIELTQRKNAKGVLADDPGKITAKLSEDKKTLTIITANSLSGNYGISFSSDIKTADGVALESYYKQITYIDTTAPYIVSTTVDDTGVIATILFNEPVNFDNMKVTGGAAVGNVSVDPSTISTLNNVLNYVVSSDKRSLKINLSNIVTADKNKLLTVYISGIKDNAGNIPANVYVQPYIQLDNSLKPQAKVLYIQRTAYNTLSAMFDRSIQTPGYITTPSGSMILGIVDPSNNKKVNYTLTGTDLTLTGVRTVGIGMYNSYNVNPSDTSANIMQDRPVDFTVETAKPVITVFVYDPETEILTLTFNEAVTLLTNTGVFNARFISSFDDIIPNTNINWTVQTHNEGNNIVKLKLANLTLNGSYTFTITEGFAFDGFQNTNMSRDIYIANSSGQDTELPAPYSIAQSAANPDQIIIKFAHKLDKASAEALSNYSVAGVTLMKAELTDNTTETGATVILTIAPESNPVTISRPVSITGVRGYNNSYSAITLYSGSVELKENKKPSWVSNTFDTQTRNVIKMNFDEAVQGTLIVKVSMLSGAYELPNNVSISGNTVNITLTSQPAAGSLLKVEILHNGLTDLSGNSVKAMAASYVVVASY